MENVTFSFVSVLYVCVCVFTHTATMNQCHHLVEVLIHNNIIYTIHGK